jgi:hypothetical protein
MSIISSEQIQKDIDKLPEVAQYLLIDFIQILRKRYPEVTTQKTAKSDRPSSFLEDASEFIGCLEGGPGDLATNKKHLESLGKK